MNNFKKNPFITENQQDFQLPSLEKLNNTVKQKKIISGEFFDKETNQRFFIKKDGTKILLKDDDIVETTYIEKNGKKVKKTIIRKNKNNSINNKNSDANNLTENKLLTPTQKQSKKITAKITVQQVNSPTSLSITPVTKTIELNTPPSNNTTATASNNKKENNLNNEEPPNNLNNNIKNDEKIKDTQTNFEKDIDYLINNFSKINLNTDSQIDEVHQNLQLIILKLNEVLSQKEEYLEFKEKFIVILPKYQELLKKYHFYKNLQKENELEDYLKVPSLLDKFNNIQNQSEQLNKTNQQFYTSIIEYFNNQNLSKINIIIKYIASLNRLFFYHCGILFNSIEISTEKNQNLPTQELSTSEIKENSNIENSNINNSNIKNVNKDDNSLNSNENYKKNANNNVNSLNNKEIAIKKVDNIDTIEIDTSSDLPDKIKNDEILFENSDLTNFSNNEDEYDEPDPENDDTYIENFNNKDNINIDDINDIDENAEISIDKADVENIHLFKDDNDKQNIVTLSLENIHPEIKELLDSDFQDVKSLRDLYDYLSNIERIINRHIDEISNLFKQNTDFKNKVLVLNQKYQNFIEKCRDINYTQNKAYIEIISTMFASSERNQGTQMMEIPEIKELFNINSKQDNIDINLDNNNINNNIDKNNVGDSNNGIANADNNIVLNENKFKDVGLSKTDAMLIVAENLEKHNGRPNFQKMRETVKLMHEQNPIDKKENKTSLFSTTNKIDEISDDINVKQQNLQTQQQNLNKLGEYLQNLKENISADNENNSTNNNVDFNNLLRDLNEIQGDTNKNLNFPSSNNFNNSQNLNNLNQQYSNDLNNNTNNNVDNNVDNNIGNLNQANNNSQNILKNENLQENNTSKGTSDEPFDLSDDEINIIEDNNFNNQNISNLNQNNNSNQQNSNNLNNNVNNSNTSTNNNAGNFNNVNVSVVEAELSTKEKFEKIKDKILQKDFKGGIDLLKEYFLNKIDLDKFKNIKIKKEESFKVDTTPIETINNANNINNDIKKLKDTNIAGRLLRPVGIIAILIAGLGYAASDDSISQLIKDNTGIDIKSYVSAIMGNNNEPLILKAPTNNNNNSIPNEIPNNVNSIPNGMPNSVNNIPNGIHSNEMPPNNIMPPIPNGKLSMQNEMNNDMPNNINNNFLESDLNINLMEDGNMPPPLKKENVKMAKIVTVKAGGNDNKNQKKSNFNQNNLNNNMANMQLNKQNMIAMQNNKNKMQESVLKDNNKKNKKNNACSELNLHTGMMDSQSANLRSLVSGEAVFNNGCRLKTGMKLGSATILEIDSQTFTIRTNKGNIHFD